MKTALKIAIVLSALLAYGVAYADRVVVVYEDGTKETFAVSKPYKSIEVRRDAPPPPPEPTKVESKSFIDVPFDAVNRGQVVKIKYYSAEALSATAWLGIIPMSAPHEAYESDKLDVLFVYLKGKMSGTISLQIPANIPQGEYEVRIFESDGNGREVVVSAPFYIY